MVTLTFLIFFLNPVLFYTTIIAGSTALNAAVPLLFELACELAYPTGEGTTNGVLTIVNNLCGLIFLFVFMIPDVGKSLSVASHISQT